MKRSIWPTCSTARPSWAANFAGGSTNANAAPDADPDQDGENNAAEYVTGGNPNSAAPRLVVTDLETIGTNQYLRVTVPKNPAATDALILVDAAANAIGTDYVPLAMQANVSGCATLPSGPYSPDFEKDKKVNLEKARAAKAK